MCSRRLMVPKTVAHPARRLQRLASAAAVAAVLGTVSRSSCYVPNWSPPVVIFGKRFRGSPEVPSGLQYFRDFVGAEEELELVQTCDGKSAAWMRHIRRAQQFFGLVYYQTSQVLPALQPTQDSPATQQRGRPLADLPPWLLPRVLGTGVFRHGVNQVQANEYLEDSGIGLHVEDPAAGPAFATVSLLQPVQLTLMRAVEGRPPHRNVRDSEDCVKVLLEPRSLLVLQGESRHRFAHAIRQSRLVPLPEGGMLRRGTGYRRISLTFRGIIESERSTQRHDMPQGYVPFTLPDDA